MQDISEYTPMPQDSGVKLDDVVRMNKGKVLTLLLRLFP